MKYILIFFISFFSLAFGLVDPDPPQCIDGVGHVKHRYLYSLHDTTGIAYYFDTTIIQSTYDGDDYYDTIEWKIIPAGVDTFFYQCARCDSIVTEISDTLRILSRVLSNTTKITDIAPLLPDVPEEPGGDCIPYVRNVQILTSSGTWTKPDSILMLEVVCIAGGGGGGSGEKTATGVVARGGGGGAPGSIAWHRLFSDELDSTEPYTIGAGGTGGAAQTTNSTTGNTGANGGDTYFGGTDYATSFVYAKGGKGAVGNAGGVNGSAADNKPASCWVSLYGATSNSTGSTSSAVNQDLDDLYYVLHGAGSGRGITTAELAGSGGGGACRYYIADGTQIASNNGSSNSDGNNGTDYILDRIPFIITSELYGNVGYGQSGSGGASNKTGNAYKGGNGGKYGGAGGGGGGARNDQGNSGAGGDGSDGVIILIEYLISGEL